jgi:hypothetical protein
MRLGRTTLAILLATLWVGVGLHCRLETFPGLEFLSCCDHAAPDKSPAHQDNDCEGDGCAAIESGSYQLQPPQSAPVKPLLALVAWLTPLPDTGQLSSPALPVAVLPSPPEFLRLWQFTHRAALPPRAPTFVS